MKPCPEQRSDHFDDFEIWCDKPSDLQLVGALSPLSRFLSRVGRVNILPGDSPEALSRGPAAHVAPLVEYDRPDIMIFYRKRPCLIVEITEHGYTGDNPLQRFARAVRSTELGSPFIHFTPFSRSRLDELLISDRPTSRRNVSARLFKGFVRLTEIYGIPVMGFDWPVGEQGTPLKASSLSDGAELRAVFGELVNVIDHLCLSHADEIIDCRPVLYCSEIRPHLEKTAALAAAENILASEIRIPNTPFDRVRAVINRPAETIDLLREPYFFKGKEHKFVAYRALQESSIRYLELPGRRVSYEAERLNDLPPTFAEKRWVLVFSGYEWRSEPNGGITVNADITLCRSRTGRTVRDRDQLLVVHWPRVFLESTSPVRIALLEELRDVSSDIGLSRMAALIRQSRTQKGLPANQINYIAYGTRSLGVWTERSTIARIYRQFCDLVILNDAVLLGNHWRR